MHRAHNLSRQRGFTLLELLIATAVGAVVLIVIQTTFFGALRLHNTTHARIDSDLLLQRALGLVRKDFAGIMLPGGLPNASSAPLRQASFHCCTVASSVGGSRPNSSASSRSDDRVVSTWSSNSRRLWVLNRAGVSASL